MPQIVLYSLTRHELDGNIHEGGINVQNRVVGTTDPSNTTDARKKLPEPKENRS